MPASGDWTVTANCTISSFKTAPGNVTVNAGITLTIAPTGVLEINLNAKKLLVKNTGKVLVQQGGAIAQTDRLSPLPGGTTGGSVFHHADHLSEASVDTDTAGNVLQLTDYYPYGDSRIEEATAGFHNDYTYTGKERDEDTELLYYEARYYDSHLGRFISLDPHGGNVSDPQSLNKYTYVLNNPFKYIDPDGKETKIVIRFPNGKSLDDFGHVMIKIDDEYYGWISRGGLFGKLGVMDKRGHDNRMQTGEDYKNGTFLYFTLNISEKDEDNLQAELNAKNYETTKEEDERTDTENYNLVTNDCVDVAVQYLSKYIPELEGLNGTPETLADDLLKKYDQDPSTFLGLKGGYSIDSQFTSVNNLQRHRNTIFGKLRRTVYDIYREIKEAREKSE